MSRIIPVVPYLYLYIPLTVTFQLFFINKRLACQVRHGPNFIAENPRNRANWRDVILIANTVRKKSITNFPSKDSRIFTLKLFDVSNYLYKIMKNVLSLAMPLKFEHFKIRCTLLKMQVHFKNGYETQMI